MKSFINLFSFLVVTLFVTSLSAQIQYTRVNNQDGMHVFEPSKMDATEYKGFKPVSYTHLDVYKRQVYLSVFNAADKDEVLRKINNHTHVLKQALAARIKNQIRRIPQIHFYFDETIEEMYKVNALFDEIKTMYPPSVQEEE